MISVQSLVSNLRIELKDIQETQHSDWDLLNALNKAIRMINLRFANMQNVVFTESMVEYQKDDVISGIDLPPDCMVIISVTDCKGHRLSPATGVRVNHKSYQVVNDKIYADNAILVRYKRMLPPAEQGGTIDVPAKFFDLICQTARMIMETADNETVIGYLKGAAADYQRVVSHAHIRPPFRC